MSAKIVICAVVSVFGLLASAAGFEGRVTAALAQGGETNELLYVAGRDSLRIERVSTNLPYPLNLVALKSGAVTLVFPHNRSFMRLKNVATRVPPAGERGILPSNFPALPSTVPPLPAASPGPGLLAMPLPMPPMPISGQASSLTQTTTNRTINGLICSLYTITNHFESLEVWATPDSVLFPFRLLERNAPTHRFGPQHLGDQWAELLQKQSLFPLEATLRNSLGIERFSFKVTAIENKEIQDKNGELFAVPSGYYEIQPPPF